MWNWLVVQWQWPYAVVMSAGFLLTLLPIVLNLGGEKFALIYLQLPLYLLHQWEEHRHDAFRQFVNRVIGGGREALTPTATFWINALGVWGVDLVAIYLAWAVKPVAGLVAGYMAVVNAILHLGPALKRREYNPGLLTALLLFLPLGGWCIFSVGAGAGFEVHFVSLSAAIIVHLLIVAHVMRRLARLPQPA